MVAGRRRPHQRSSIERLRHTRGVRFSRLTLIALCVVLGLAALAPAAALASGPSAGDQQYVDPLGGSTGSRSSGSSSSGSSGSSAASSSSTAGQASQGTVSSTPTATAASTTSATTASGHALPFTGFNAWEGALIGVALVGAGATVRRRATAR